MPGGSGVTFSVNPSRTPRPTTILHLESHNAKLLLFAIQMFSASNIQTENLHNIIAFPNGLCPPTQDLLSTTAFNCSELYSFRHISRGGQ